jgi:hypothetical protein
VSAPTKIGSDNSVCVPDLDFTWRYQTNGRFQIGICVNQALSMCTKRDFHNDSQSSAALSSRALKALEYCLGGRENRNPLRSPIEHSRGEGSVDDAK